MDIKKIIIISAVFFPRNSPRANRATELAKEFSRQGHDVTVYAVLGKYDYTDFENTYNLKIKNLGKMRFAITSSDEIDVNYNFITKAGAKLLNRFIEFPLIEHFFKVYKTLKNQKELTDLLITIAVPYTIHWGAAFAKGRTKNFPKTWIADCGDPYMGNPNIKRMFYFKYIEKWFCKKTNYIAVPTYKALNAYYPEFRKKIKIIPQGFNFDEYKAHSKYTKNVIPTFIYAGAFYENIRDPRPFLNYLTNVSDDFKFIIYTKNQKIVDDYVKKLKHKLEVKSFIPRKEVIKEFAKADFLINFENQNNVQSPSKLIDYILAKRPIYNVSDNNSFKDFKLFLKGDYSQSMVVDSAENYDIKNIAKEFIKLIND